MIQPKIILTIEKGPAMPFSRMLKFFFYQVEMVKTRAPKIMISTIPCFRPIVVGISLGQSHNHIGNTIILAVASVCISWECFGEHVCVSGMSVLGYFLKNPFILGDTSISCGA